MYALIKNSGKWLAREFDDYQDSDYLDFVESWAVDGVPVVSVEELDDLESWGMEVDIEVVKKADD